MLSEMRYYWAYSQTTTTRVIAAFSCRSGLKRLANPIEPVRSSIWNPPKWDQDLSLLWQLANVDLRLKERIPKINEINHKNEINDGALRGTGHTNTGLAIVVTTPHRKQGWQFDRKKFVRFSTDFMADYHALFGGSFKIVVTTTTMVWHVSPSSSGKTT